MLAFFTAALAVSLAVLGVATSAPYAAVAGAAFLIAVAASAFELFPVRIDDNLTIPLFVGFTGWIACALFGVSLA